MAGNINIKGSSIGTIDGCICSGSINIGKGSHVEKKNCVEGFGFSIDPFVVIKKAKPINSNTAENK